MGFIIAFKDPIMPGKKTRLAVLILLLALVLPAAAGLFGPPRTTYKGYVNFLQATNFTILTANNQVARVIVPSDRKIPPEVQLGVYVEVSAVQGSDQLWYLDKFTRIQLQPNQ